jgi:ABC-type cobalamin/Fe3+-siderophores transport system ATPase subunit
MRDGRIEQAGPKEEVVTRSIIESAYGIQLAELRESGGRMWPIWQTSERSAAE